MMVVSDCVSQEKWRLSKPLDLTQKQDSMSNVRDADGGSQREYEENSGYGFDSCGAMDLSSNCSSSIKAQSDEEFENFNEQRENCRKRKAEEMPDTVRNKKEKMEDAEQSEEEDQNQLNMRNKRKNIKDVIEEEKLDLSTKAAKAEEEERLRRLRDQNKMLMAEALRTNHDRYNSPLHTEEDESFIQCSSTGLGEQNKPELVINSDSDECKVISDDAESMEDDEEEDPNNSGMHVNDALNIRNIDGNVLVNVGHPDEDNDIYLASQLAHCIKPHQIGGVRFMYDNVIESTSRFSSSQGFGCILAHSMGLGKTMQIVTFTDIFLSHTPAQKVLCIVPINTIQNWLSEFNYWLPAQGQYSKIAEKKVNVKCRDFQIYVLNDSLKNLHQRAGVIGNWNKNGGVLLMGYELYRQLANKKPRKKKQKGHGFECIDIEEEDKNRGLLNDIQSALVRPGPDLVICDEGHRIKNSHASISQALKQIKTKRRIVLTGYPLQNNLMEYWCMVDFVRPNFLGNKTEFSNMFERPIQNGQCIDSTPKDVRLMKHRAHVLHEQLKGFVQRRGHTVLRQSLPAKTEHVLFVRMTAIQRRLYRRFMEELIDNRCVSNPLKAFAVCCKIWNHPDVLYNFLKKKEDIDIDFDPEEVMTLSATKPGKEEPEVQLPFGKKEEINYDWAQGMLTKYTPELEDNSNKLQIFLGILEESLAVNDRILLFSQSLFTLNLIEEFLRRKKLSQAEEPWQQGTNYFRLDGSTSALERERLINNFNNNTNIKLFLVSTRAGSLGVNLVGANRVVIFDASWNPCHDTQAVCRVYRYGQTKATHVYRLVTDNSLEKKIYDRQVNKQGMADRIVDELNPDAHLSSKEVHSLICDEGEDPEESDMLDEVSRFEDPVMRKIVSRFGTKLTKAPFAHESLLVDRKDNKLSNAEKKLAERAYKLERTSKITYSRPSYAAFYPKQGNFATNLHNPGSNGYTRNRYFENGKRLENWVPPNQSLTKPIASVRPMQSELTERPQYSLSVPLPDKSDPYQHVESAFPIPSFSNVLSAPPEKPAKTTSEWTQKEQIQPDKSIIQNLVSHSLTVTPPPHIQKPNFNTTSALEALSNQGVGLQEVSVPRDLVIPTGTGTAPISLTAGQMVMVIKTPKGIYLRMEEKIIKIKQPQAVQNLLGVPISGSVKQSSSSGHES
jgi:RAD54-like protein 2